MRAGSIGREFVRAGSISIASILPNTVIEAARDVGSQLGAL